MFSKEYQAFIKSPEWLVMRALVFKRDAHKCVKCGRAGSRSNPIQANHLTYPKHGALVDEFINQPLEQIETLCKKCHEIKTQHSRQKAKWRTGSKI